MIFLGMFGLWGTYALGSWGWCLVTGKNITLREWVSPLHPFDWASGVKCIPPGSIFPKLNAGVACPQSTAASGKASTPPGTPQGSEIHGGSAQTYVGQVPVTGVLSRYLG